MKQMRPRFLSSLTFLGTSSGVPTQHRNVQSYCLNFSDGATWMFDCGEGTQHQLQRCKTVSQGKIERIFVTHLHGDHCYGLPGLMCTLSLMWQGDAVKKKATASASAKSSDDDDCEHPPEGEEITFENFSKQSEYLELVGPKDLAKFLRSAFICSDAHFPFKYRVTELWPVEAAKDKEAAETAPRHPCEAPMRIIFPSGSGVYETIDSSEAFQGLTVKAAQLTHRIFCVGYCVTESDTPAALDMDACQRLGVPKGPLLAQLKAGKSISFPDPEKEGASKTVTAAQVLGSSLSGRKIVLLGDTCNSNEMLQIGKGAEWVVHEATFDDKSTHLAVPRGHSTSRMAARFACQLDAKKLLLTHFSARFRPKSAETDADEGISKLEREARAEICSIKGLPEDTEESASPTVAAMEDFTCVDLTRKR